MKPELKPGLRYTHTFTVPSSKTVPALYPEAPEFVAMPEVFATGFLVGFLEWACIKALHPYLDWPNEMTLGTHIDVSHEAATPVGRVVTADVELIEAEGKRLLFKVAPISATSSIAISLLRAYKLMHLKCITLQIFQSNNL